MLEANNCSLLNNLIQPLFGHMGQTIRHTSREGKKLGAVKHNLMVVQSFGGWEGPNFCALGPRVVAVVPDRA